MAGVAIHLLGLSVFAFGHAFDVVVVAWTFDVSVAKIVPWNLLSLNGVSVGIDAVTSGPMTLFSRVITIGFAIWETQVHDDGRSVEEVVGFDGRVTAGKLRLRRADTIGQDVGLGDGLSAIRLNSDHAWRTR